MSWRDCMRAKIVAHYGPQVSTCADAIREDNFDTVVRCMVDVLKISNSAIWMPQQLAYLTQWSLECRGS